MFLSGVDTGVLDPIVDAVVLFYVLGYSQVKSSKSITVLLPFIYGFSNS
jgi:hypothetical protein